MDRTAFKDSIEKAIDKIGISGVLYVVSEILDSKGEHLEHYWQDAKTANEWYKTAGKISKAADKIRKIIS